MGRVSSSIMQAVNTGQTASMRTPPPPAPPSTSPGAYGPAASVKKGPVAPREERVRVPDTIEPRPVGRASTPAARSQRAPPPGVIVQDAPIAAPSSAKAATFGSGSSVTVSPLRELPPDSLVDALSNVLRSFPEVEWAALCLTSRGPATPLPTVGLRVDTGFRARVNDIIAGVRETGDTHGASLDVLLLDNPEVMRTARNDALVFYPWRRTPTRSS